MTKCICGKKKFLTPGHMSANSVVQVRQLLGIENVEHSLPNICTFFALSEALDSIQFPSQSFQLCHSSDSWKNLHILKI